MILNFSLIISSPRELLKTYFLITSHEILINTDTLYICYVLNILYISIYVCVYIHMYIIYLKIWFFNRLRCNSCPLWKNIIPNVNWGHMSQNRKIHKNRANPRSEETLEPNSPCEGGPGDRGKWAKSLKINWLQSIKKYLPNVCDTSPTAGYVGGSHEEVRHHPFP